MTPRLAITLGDPAGIGPEVVVKTLASARGYAPLVVGDLATLDETARRLRLSLRFMPVLEADVGRRRFASRSIPVVTSTALDERARRPGAPTREGARASYRWIEAAVRLTQSGAADAIVTAPINKELVTRAGFPISGHTELLRQLTGAREVRMMMAGRRLRVVLVTMHVALAEVSRLLTTARIATTIRITDRHLRRYHGLARPRIAVAGLNPHAGEGGLFGSEERSVIAPAIARARRGGIDASGPHPADSLFAQAVDGGYDAVIAMYHDQGLIPVKLLEFHDAVNVTLGLPTVRTSPDHGTAYTIAGKGTANPGSMTAALSLAAKLARSAAQTADQPARRHAS